MNKKMWITVLTALVALSVFCGAAMAGASSKRQVEGPYEGTFEGYAYGDKDSRALLTLDLTHRDGVVYGVATIENGLYVSAGRCGGGYLPGTSQYIRGVSLASNPRQIRAEMKFEISGFEIGVDMESSLSRDGKVIEGELTIDIPWICGRDPVLSATLERVEP